MKKYSRKNFPPGSSHPPHRCVGNWRYWVAARKPARKVSRRSSAETAKLQKTILKGLKGGKSVASLAEEFGISKPYVYMLKNKG